MKSRPRFDLPGRTFNAFMCRLTSVRREIERWIRNFQRTRRTLEAIAALNRTLLREGQLFDADAE